MKYVLVIPDGAADERQAALGEKTPLEAARVPHMDAVARAGRVGLANHVPASLPSGSDVGTMSLFGYDPLQFHTGRAPLEAAAQNISLGDLDWAVRCNLVTILDGKMESFTADQIDNASGRDLLAALSATIAADSPWTFYPGVSYRNLAAFRPQGAPAPFARSLLTTPPHDITGKPIAGFLPQGPGADELLAWMARSREMFADHPANVARLNAGKLPATQVWLWGLGQRPALTPFRDLHGVQGAVITAVDLLRGIGRLIGWNVIEVPGATGYLDTDYAAKGKYAIEALRSGVDFVVVHVEATDEAAHEGDAAAKVKALERIDADIVGPIWQALTDMGPARMLICPDHPTFLRTRTHSHGDVPFAMAGTGVRPAGVATYDEFSAQSGPRLAEGHRLMAEFIGAAFSA